MTRRTPSDLERPPELVPTQRNDEQLRLAIEGRRLIQFRYKGSLRLAEPHDYGVQKGTVKLLAYQLRGPVREGKDVTGWRLFFVSRIEECVALEETFPGSRGRFHVNHLAWDVLYARVAGNRRQP